MQFYLALYIVHLTSFVLRLFKLGAGLTSPGYYALKLFPTLLTLTKFSYPKGTVLISGTNGKTTTAKLISHMLKTNGVSVLTNSSGANILNGIVTALLLDRDLLGNSKSDVAVLEVDEFYLPQVIELLKPAALVLLNLSRDQLDRYGEVDIVYACWQDALAQISETTMSVIVDNTQSIFSDINVFFKGTVTHFDDSPALLRHTSLVGYYNAKNVNAASTVCKLLGLTDAEIIESLKSFDAAYGRGEIVYVGDKKFRILLAKNPASFNTNLDVLLGKELDPDAVLIILNDNIPDGRDVSWIYDIESEKLSATLQNRTVYVSGTRYLDMVVRLRYAGVYVAAQAISKTPDALVENINKSGYTNILVLPNYSAMLDVRKKLVGRRIL